MFLIARSGWSKLAAAYPAPTRRLAPGGKSLGHVSARIGLAHYNGALRVGIEPQGLRLSVLFLFRAGHPPILIPWDHVSDIRQEPLILGSAYAVDIGNPRIATLTLPERVIHAIRDEAPEIAG